MATCGLVQTYIQLQQPFDTHTGPISPTMPLGGRYIQPQHRFFALNAFVFSLRANKWKYLVYLVKHLHGSVHLSL